MEGGQKVTEDTPPPLMVSPNLADPAQQLGKTKWHKISFSAPTVYCPKTYIMEKINLPPPPSN